MKLIKYLKENPPEVTYESPKLPEGVCTKMEGDFMNHIFQLEVSQNKRKNPERFFNTEMFMMMMMIRNKLFFLSSAAAAVAFSSKWLKSIQREREYFFFDGVWPRPLLL